MTKLCPNCNSECSRDEADIDVGIMYGPWGCSNCGWSEFDKSDYPELDPDKLDIFGGYKP